MGIKNCHILDTIFSTTLFMAYFGNIYSCPMETHHSSDAHSCDLSKSVQNCAINIYYLGKSNVLKQNIQFQ